MFRSSMCLGWRMRCGERWWRCRCLRNILSEENRWHGEKNKTLKRMTSAARIDNCDNYFKDFEDVRKEMLMCLPPGKHVQTGDEEWGGRGEDSHGEEGSAQVLLVENVQHCVASASLESFLQRQEQRHGPCSFRLSGSKTTISINHITITTKIRAEMEFYKSLEKEEHQAIR